VLTAFDFAVIEYAQSRGERSDAVYARIDMMALGLPYRDRCSEERLLAELERVKERDAQVETAGRV
jgi:hypothetical protein